MLSIIDSDLCTFSLTCWAMWLACTINWSNLLQFLEHLGSTMDWLIPSAEQRTASQHWHFFDDAMSIIESYNERLRGIFSKYLTPAPHSTSSYRRNWSICLEELGRGTPPNVFATFWCGFMNIALVCSLVQQAGERAKLCNTLIYWSAHLWVVQELLIGPR